MNRLNLFAKEYDSLYSVYKFAKLLFIEKINIVNIIEKIISLNLKKDLFLKIILYLLSKILHFA